MKIRKTMNMTERETIRKIIDKKISPDSPKAERMLGKPHVATALEAIFDRHGLSDDALAERLTEIIQRRPSRNKRSGLSNVTAVDANAHNAVRTAFQLKGKFTEKHEISGGMADVPDGQLDKIIDSGVEYLRIRRKGLKDDDRSDNSTR